VQKEVPSAQRLDDAGSEVDEYLEVTATAPESFAAHPHISGNYYFLEHRLTI